MVTITLPKVIIGAAIADGIEDVSRDAQAAAARHQPPAIAP